MLSWLRKKRYNVTGSGGSASAGGLINSTYAEMATKKTAGTLKPGRFYKFQYQTLFEQLETAEIVAALPETLIVQATSGNTFSPIASSVQYPDDIIHYDFDDNLCEDGITARRGFIHHRRDTVLENEAPFDYRTIVFARFAIDLASIADFAPTTGYVVGNIIKESSIVYMCRLAYTSSASLSTDSAAGYWIRLVDCSLSVYHSPTNTTWSFNLANIPVVTDDYEEYLAIPSNCKNVKIDYSPSVNSASTVRFVHNVVLIQIDGTTIFKDMFLSGKCRKLTFYGIGAFTQSGVDIRGIADNCSFKSDGTTTSVSTIQTSVNSSITGLTMMMSTLSIEFGTCAKISLYFSSLTIQRSFLNSNDSAIDVALDQSNGLTFQGIKQAFFGNCKSTVAHGINLSNGVSRFLNIDANGTKVSYLRGLTACNVTGTSNVGIFIENSNSKTFTGNLSNFRYRNSIAGTITYSSSVTDAEAIYVDGLSSVWYFKLDTNGEMVPTTLT